MIRNTSSTWGVLARWLHLFSLGRDHWHDRFRRSDELDIPARPERFFYRSIHADIGYLALLLMVLCG